MIPESRFDVEYTIKGTPICDVASRVDKAMVVQLFMQTTAILQMTPFLDSEIVM